MIRRLRPGLPRTDCYYRAASPWEAAHSSLTCYLSSLDCTINRRKIFFSLSLSCSSPQWFQGLQSVVWLVEKTSIKQNAEVLTHFQEFYYIGEIANILTDFSLAWPSRPCMVTAFPAWPLWSFHMRATSGHIAIGRWVADSLSSRSSHCSFPASPSLSLVRRSPHSGPSHWEGKASEKQMTHTWCTKGCAFGSCVKVDELPMSWFSWCLK